jgi:hypothetical protein
MVEILHPSAEGLRMTIGKYWIPAFAGMTRNKEDVEGESETD